MEEKIRGVVMYSTFVLLVLFFSLLAVAWYLIIMFKGHDKLAKKTDKFLNENFGENLESDK